MAVREIGDHSWPLPATFRYSNATDERLLGIRTRQPMRIRAARDTPVGDHKENMAVRIERPNALRGEG